MLNATAALVLGGGVAAPILGYYYGTLGSTDELRERIVIGAVSCLLLGVLLHFLARATLGDLRA